MNEKFERKWLISELAKRAGFTGGDVLILWETFEDIIKEIVTNHDELNIQRLVKLRVIDVDEHEAFDAINNKCVVLPKSYRVNWKSSMCLLDLLRPNRQKEIVRARNYKKINNDE